jgi:hypothetical protein
MPDSLSREGYSMQGAPSIGFLWISSRRIASLNENASKSPLDYL